MELVIRSQSLLSQGQNAQPQANLSTKLNLEASFCPAQFWALFVLARVAQAIKYGQGVETNRVILIALLSVKSM